MLHLASACLFSYLLWVRLVCKVGRIFSCTAISRGPYMLLQPQESLPSYSGYVFYLLSDCSGLGLNSAANRIAPALIYVQYGLTTQFIYAENSQNDKVPVAPLNIGCFACLGSCKPSTAISIKQVLSTLMK